MLIDVHSHIDRFDLEGSGPKSRLGRAGTPILVKEVLRGLAEARGTTTEAIEEEVRRTFLELVKGDPRLTHACRRVLEG